MDAGEGETLTVARKAAVPSNAIVGPMEGAADLHTFGGAQCWFAVHTQPRRETVAEACLQELRLRVFCPRYRQRVILHGYRREIVRPLFPGYLFAAFDPERDFKTVHYARGVRGVVVLGGRPAEVPLDLLHRITSQMENGLVVLQPQRLNVGQHVEITAGPFKGHTGFLAAELSGAERVAILLDTLSYTARAIIDRVDVRAIA